MISHENHIVALDVINLMASEHNLIGTEIADVRWYWNDESYISAYGSHKGKVADGIVPIALSAICDCAVNGASIYDNKNVFLTVLSSKSVSLSDIESIGQIFEEYLVRPVSIDLMGMCVSDKMEENDVEVVIIGISSTETVHKKRY